VYGLVTDEKLEHWAAKVLCKGMRTIIKVIQMSMVILVAHFCAQQKEA